MTKRGWARVPYKCFDKESAKALIQELTFTPKKLDPDGEDPAPVVFCVPDKETKTVLLPRAFALAEYPEATVDLCDGFPITVEKLPSPTHPSAPAGQSAFNDNCLRVLHESNTCMGLAATGAGKTTSLLWLIGKLGRTALVIVPTRAIATQWKDEAILHLGIKDEEVGLLMGANVEWEGKKIVIAVIHNLIQKEWPEEFYRYFGFVGMDEIHKVNAGFFLPALGMFPARYQICVTATPKRKDGMHVLVKYMMAYKDSQIATSESEALPCTCQPVRWERVYQLTGWYKTCSRMQQRAALLKQAVNDAERNAMLARIILEAYEDGREILGVSDRKEHLKVIKELLEAGGAQNIGFFMGGMTPAQLDKTKKESTIILATINMIKEGVNIPRLDFGIDLTPRSDGVQKIGRVRRPYPNKRLPIWVTIIDRTPIFRAMAVKCIADFISAGVEILPEK